MFRPVHGSTGSPRTGWFAHFKPLVLSLSKGGGAFLLATLTTSSNANVAGIPELPTVDHVLVDKSDRTITLFSDGQTVRTIGGIQLGDAPEGHKQFEGDERTPEGRYMIDYGNPESAYYLSLHISYPNEADSAYAEARGRSPGGQIFIHGQPNALPVGRVPGDWTDGCIAVSNAEIEWMWRTVPNGTVIEIIP